MAAALLAPGRTTLDEVPDILDVAIMSEVLRRLGCAVSYERTPGSGGGGRLVVDVPENPSTETDYDLVRRGDGEPGHGRGPCQGRDRGGQRGPRTGDRRPLPDAERDGRLHRGGRHLDDHGGGR